MPRLGMVIPMCARGLLIALLKLGSSHWKAIKALLHTMFLTGIALGIALLVPFFYLVQHSRALQPRPLPSVQNFSNGGKINVLLVVAHPDDESMFFGPTLLSLAQLDLYNIRALCYSTGNADGLGTVRKSEMTIACSVLKIPTESVDVVDHPALQDGFSSLWDQSLIVKLLKQTVADHNIQVILTFDDYGISGHPNHRAVHSGVRTFLLEEGKATKSKGGFVKEVLQGWELVSTNILRKYSGPLELCAPLLERFISYKDNVHHLANPSPWTSIVAMSHHKSQWVCQILHPFVECGHMLLTYATDTLLYVTLRYRRLFVLFSRYTYINTLKKMPG